MTIYLECFRGLSYRILIISYYLHTWFKFDFWGDLDPALKRLVIIVCTHFYYIFSFSKKNKNKKSASCEAHVLIQFQNEVATTGGTVTDNETSCNMPLKSYPIFVNYSGVNIVFIFGMCNLLCVVVFLYISLFFRKKEKRKQAHPWGLVLLP